jgi:hypothetical protein
MMGLRESYSGVLRLLSFVFLTLTPIKAFWVARKLLLMNMNRSAFFPLVLSACALATAAAEVPSLINYQGRITGPGGAPATGTRNFELKIYDAQAGGNLLYSEDMGAITLGEGGVYGFRFGASGTSVATRSETLATTDGTLTVFNGTLSATAIPGSVSLSDGTFTWSQSAGSSAPANFIGSFVAANGTASAIYIQGAPAAGTPIEVSFNYEEAGITGALSSGSSHWIELTVDGTVQATRERVLAVPFALKSNVAERVLSIDESKLSIQLMTLSRLIDEVASHVEGLSSPSYLWEDFPDGQSGRNRSIDETTLSMTWDESMETLTTRGLLRSINRPSNSPSLDETWMVNGNVQNIVTTGGSTGGIQGWVSINGEFRYADGTASAFSVPRAIDHNIPNPNPTRLVRSIRIWGPAPGGGNYYLDHKPTYIQSEIRSVEIRLGDLPDGLFALNCSALGSASEGKTFTDCLKWRVRYTDGTLSDQQDLGSVIPIAPGKTPSHARVMTVPAILQDGSVDITKITVRLVTN